MTTMTPALWGFWVNLVLVLATLIIAIFAVVQALASKASVRAQTPSLRPCIAAEPHGDVLRMLQDRNAPRIQIELVNRGVTTTCDILCQSWIELLPFPFKDFTASASSYKHDHPAALYPNHSPWIINIPIQSGITEAQQADLRGLRLDACIRIYVTYRDAFSGDRYANFGFYIAAEGLGFLPKYNDAN
jgi:hypothetical protein